MARANDEQSSGGFTIIELLVTLIIFALVLLVVPTSLQFNRRIWAEESALQREQARAAFADHVRPLLARAQPQLVRTATGQIAVQFEGGPDRIDFLAIAANGEARGGPYRFQIGNDTGGGGAGLIFQQSVYPPPASGQDGALDPTTVSRALSSARIRFSYYGPVASGKDSAWQDTWRRRQTLPRLVAFELEPLQGETFAPVRHAVELRLAQ